MSSSIRFKYLLEMLAACIDFLLCPMKPILFPSQSGKQQLYSSSSCQADLSFLTLAYKQEREAKSLPIQSNAVVMTTNVLPFFFQKYIHETRMRIRMTH